MKKKQIPEQVRDDVPNHQPLITNHLNRQRREMYFRAQAWIGVFNFNSHVTQRAQLLDHRKSDARTTRLPSHFVFDSVEFLEDLFHLARRNARTIVADRKVHVRILDSKLDVDHLVISRFRELERVINEVHQNLHDGVAVNHEADIVCIGIRRNREFETLLFDVLAVSRYKVIQNSLGLVHAELHIPTVAIELGEVQHVLD